MFSSTLDADIAQRGHLTWAHIQNIRARWHGNLVLKGVLTAADARLAREYGVDGIIVANFAGGPVMLDGGVRRGTDVLKALALGAACVFVGRPFNYAAAVAGQAGVAHAIELLQLEIARNMAMLGLCSLDEVTPELLQKHAADAS